MKRQLAEEYPVIADCRLPIADLKIAKDQSAMSY
jgi:hypothetical protein